MLGGGAIAPLLEGGIVTSLARKNAAMTLQSTRRHYLILLFCAGIVFFTNLGTPKLWDWDEPRNAGCAAEMLAAGDWIVPVFNGELRVHKPILLYWFMLTAYEMFGVTEFAARFWSAVLGVGTVLMTYHIARRLFDGATGLLAGVALASTLSFGIAARAATPDSVLIFFTTAATLVYVLGTFRSREASGEGRDAEQRGPVLRVEGHYFPQSWPVAMLMYALMGMAVLAKGPVGLVLPTAVIGMFLLIRRLPAISDWDVARIKALRYHLSGWLRGAFDFLCSLRVFGPIHFLKTCWYMRPLTAIAMVLLVAGPWYYWVGVQTDGQWLRGFFLDHNVGRFANAMEGHSGSPLYYPAAILIFTFPWSVFAVPLLIDLVRRMRRNDPWNDGLLLAVCWICVYVGVFTTAGTKLPSYIAPMYPAMAMLFAAYFRNWASSRQLSAGQWAYGAMAVLAFVGIGIAVALPIIASIFVPGEQWLGVIGALPAAAAIVFLVLMRKEKRWAAVTTMAATSVLFATFLFGIAASQVSKHQDYGRLMAEIKQQSDNPRIAAFGCLEPSWVFYSGRTVEHLPNAVHGPAKGEAETQANLRRAVADMQRFFDESGEEGLIITTQEQFELLEPSLGADVQVVAETPYFLKDKTLVLLAPNGDASPRTALRDEGGTTIR